MRIERVNQLSFLDLVAALTGEGGTIKSFEDCPVARLLKRSHKDVFVGRNTMKADGIFTVMSDSVKQFVERFDAGEFKGVVGSCRI